MSIKIMSWVLDHSPYRGKMRLVHLVLADHANDDGECWPSQAQIARRAGCTVETVRTTVRTLIDDGYLEITRPSSREGDSHHYRLLSPNGLGAVPKSFVLGPQIIRAGSPNLSPSNRQEPSKNRRTRACEGCGTDTWTKRLTDGLCPVCHERSVR